MRKPFPGANLPGTATLAQAGQQAINAGRKPSPLPDFSWIEVYSEIPSDNLIFRARLGEEPIKQSGGGAGWNSVQRPQKRPLVVRRGPTTAFTLTIPIVFDGYTEVRSVESDIRALEKMAGINVDGDPEPPLLVINGNGAIPWDVFAYPQGRWVVDDTQLDWGEALRHATRGFRMRQLVTVPFMLYTADDQLSRSKQVASARYTTARAGDTFAKVAARDLKQYGGARLGNRLAQFNGKRDGAQKLEPGQLVKLPTAAQVQDWLRKPRR